MKFSKIIINTPIRSGSTLVYNIVRILFPDMHIIKSHGKTEYNSDALYISTIRHPYNSIVSYMLANQININDETLKNNCDVYLDCFPEIKKSYEGTNIENIIILDYESLNSASDYLTVIS